MISKIIALAIALVLLVSAPVYSAVVTPATPVEFGAGNGTSATIANSEELSTLIASIPDINTYIGVDSIKEVNPDFRSLTMVESGYGKTTDPTKTTMKVKDPNGIEEYRPVYREDITMMSHTLEIAFAENGVYYTCVGENTTETILWEMDDHENKVWNIFSAEKTTTAYAFELYYAKDTVLIKYNDFDTTNEDCGFASNIYEYNNEAQIPYQPVVLTEEDDDYEDYKLQTETEAALSKCFGKWMRVELPDENAVPEEPDWEAIGNMSEEDQLQYMIDMQVQMLVAKFSTATIQSFTQTHAQNQAYLAGLGAFMLTGNLNFKTLGDRHMLKDTADARDAYLAAVIPTNATVFKMSEYNSNVYFTTNDSAVDLVQIVNLIPRSVEGRQMTDVTAVIETITTFKNVDNTVANLKDANIDTVYNVFKEPFGEMLRNMMMEEAENNG